MLQSIESTTDDTRNSTIAVDKWNSVGIVTAYNGSVQGKVGTDDDDYSIEVEFHDASIYSTFVIDNSVHNYAYADLSTEALVLAAKGSSEWAGRVYVRHLSAWDQTSREWTTDLPIGELVENVCIGYGWIAVITSIRNVRIFTVSGMQRFIWTAAKSIRTLCAFDNRLALAYGNISDECETINDTMVDIFEINCASLYQTCMSTKRVDIALGPNASLQWLGYSKQGNLCSMDSNGCIRILLAQSSMWIPIYYAIRLTATDHIWPISITESSTPQICYVYCKRSKYPRVNPRPTPRIDEWKLTMCDSDSEKTQFEETLLMNEILQHQTIKSNTDDVDNLTVEYNQRQLTTVMRMFALACKSERQCRALEMAEMMPTSQGLQMLIDYASKTRHSTLADKVANIARNRTVDVDDNDDDDYDRQPNRSLSRTDRTDIDDQMSIRRPSIALRSTKSTLSADRVPIEVDDDDDESPSSIDNPLVNGGNKRQSSPNLIFPRNGQSCNPFKRSTVNLDESSASSTSIFDRFESSSQPIDDNSMVADLSMFAKRSRMETKKRQALLNFESTATVRPDNTSSSLKNTAIDTSAVAYSLWLDANRERLQMENAALGGSEFAKFTAQQFRTMKPAEKKMWIEKATTTGGGGASK